MDPYKASVDRYSSDERQRSQCRKASQVPKRPSPWAVKKAVDNFLEIVVFCTLLSVVVGALVGLLALMIVSFDDDSYQRSVDTAQAQNLFWDQLTGAEADESPAGRLAQDLRPYVGEETVTEAASPLPVNLTKAYVTPGTYAGVRDQLDLRVFSGIRTTDGEGGLWGDPEKVSAVTNEGGYLTPEFLGMLETVRDGDVDQLKVEVPAPPGVPGRHLVPAHLLDHPGPGLPHHLRLRHVERAYTPPGLRPPGP